MAAQGSQRGGRLLYLAKIGLIAGSYYGSAKLGLNLAFATSSVTAIWPPTGIALAALVIWGRSYWPGVALGALLAARELGLRCPKDISIIGFDNLDLGMFTDPALSSVHQSGYQMGARAARLLLERIQGKKGRAQQIVLPTELKIRNSVAPQNEAPRDKR